MSVYQLSIIFLVGSLFFAIAIYIFFRPRKYQLKSAIIAGVVLSTLNFLLEVIAHKLNWYHTSGAFEIFDVPLSLSIMWFSLGIVFCLIYSYLDNFRNPRIARVIFIIASAISGTIYDIKIGTNLGFVKFEKAFTAYHIFAVWFTLTLITVLFYNFLLRKFSKNE